MRRFYPQAVSLSDEDEAQLDALSAEHDELAEGYSSFNELPEDVAANQEAVSDEIDAISAKRYAYDANVIAHGGAFVVLHHDCTARTERGFVRAEGEALADPQLGPEADSDPDLSAGRGGRAGRGRRRGSAGFRGRESGKPISDSLTHNLSAYRTLALRVALAERLDRALIALTTLRATASIYMVSVTWT